MARNRSSLPHAAANSKEESKLSIERWIWSNANLANPDVQEFQIRLCDHGLDKRKSDLIAISNRLVATEKRRGAVATQKCWFAGYLGPDLYVVALGGEQNSLLNTRYQGTRGLFCTMAYGFTGDDIRLFHRDEGMFEPLKKLLREVNETGKHSAGAADPFLKEFCRGYAVHAAGVAETTGDCNILRSSSDADSNLWMQSLKRPVMIGMVDAQEAEKLLNRFPKGAATAVGASGHRYQPVEDAGSRVNQWDQRSKIEKVRAEEDEAILRKSKEEERAYREQREREREQHRKEEDAELKSIAIKAIVTIAVVAGIVLFLFLRGRR